MFNKVYGIEKSLKDYLFIFHYLRVKFRSGYHSTLLKAFWILRSVFLRSFLNFDILIVVKVSDLAISFIQLFHILTLDFI